MAAIRFHGPSCINFCDIEHLRNGAIVHPVKSFINQYFCVDNTKSVLYSYSNITAILFWLGVRLQLKRFQLREDRWTVGVLESEA